MSESEPQRIVIAHPDESFSTRLSEGLQNTESIGEITIVTNGEDVIQHAQDPNVDAVFVSSTIQQSEVFEVITRVQKSNKRVIVSLLHLSNQSYYSIHNSKVDGIVTSSDSPNEIATVIDPTSQAIVTNSVGQLVLQNMTTGVDANKLLSAREMQVASLYAQDYRTREIAIILHLSPKTIEAHRESLKRKIGCKSVAGFTQYVLANGFGINKFEQD